MKLRIIEEENRGHENVSSISETLLLEKDWYGINYEFDDNNLNRQCNKLFVYAKSKDQARKIFNSAERGFYTANNKEQSLNRDLVDILKTLNNLKIVKVDKPVDYKSIPHNSDILTKRDRQLRQEAQNELEKNLAAVPDKFQKYKHLIHHIDEDEHNNDISNMMLVTYNDHSDLKIAHAIHQLIHMTNNNPKSITGGGPISYIIDMSTNPPSVLNVYITIR